MGVHLYVTAWLLHFLVKCFCVTSFGGFLGGGRKCVHRCGVEIECGSVLCRCGAVEPWGDGCAWGMCVLLARSSRRREASRLLTALVALSSTPACSLHSCKALLTMQSFSSYCT